MIARPGTDRSGPSRACAKASGKARKVALCTLLVVAIFFLLFEAVLRWTGYRGPDFAYIVRQAHNDTRYPEVVPDRMLLYKLQPHKSFMFGHAPVRANSDGFYTEDIPVRRRSGFCRIVYLGASAAFGWSLERRFRYSEVLQRMLCRVLPDKRFETVNLALPGYSSFQQRRVMEVYGRRYRPDVVVADIGANDVCLADGPSDEMLARIANPGRVRERLGHMRVWQLAGQVNARLRKAWRRRPVQRVSLRGTKRNLETIAAVAKEIGARTVFVSYAARNEDIPPDWAAFRRVAAPVASRAQCPYVFIKSMTESAAYSNSHLFLDAFHPTREGHVLIAARLLPSLLESICTDAERQDVALMSLQQAQRLWPDGGDLEAAIAHAAIASQFHDEALAILAAAYVKIGAYEDAIVLCGAHKDAVLQYPAAAAALATARRLCRPASGPPRQ